MDLNFLGKGSAFNPKCGNTSAYFVHNNDLFLIDCGESVFEKIFNLNVFKECDSIYVLITHLHSDHIGSLGSLISYCQLIMKKNIYVIHPEESINDYLRLVGISKEYYIYLPKLPISLKDIIIKPVEVKHVKDMKCYGYLIETINEKIYYSGDASNIPENILNEFNDLSIDKIYQDTSNHISPNHLYIDKLSEIISVKNRNRVFCMHLDINSEELIRKTGFNIVDIID